MRIKTQNAIDKAGSGAELARILNVTRSYIGKFKHGYLPAELSKKLVEVRHAWFPVEAEILANDMIIRATNIKIGICAPYQPLPPQKRYDSRVPYGARSRRGDSFVPLSAPKSIGQNKPVKLGAGCLVANKPSK